MSDEERSEKPVRCEKCEEPIREGEDVAFRAVVVKALESGYGRVEFEPVHLGCASKNRYEPPDVAA